MTAGRKKRAALILVCALALLAVGIAAGQPGEVYAKAAQICMECIGLG